MWVRIKDIKLPAEITENEQTELSELKTAACAKLRVRANDVQQVLIFRKSPDLRREKPFFVYTADIKLRCKIHTNNIFTIIPDKSKNAYDEYILYIKNKMPDIKINKKNPIIVGFGPAGIFAALIMTELGFKPIIIERGQRIEERAQSAEQFWKYGRLNTESNIQFGEGGAGTFSDGKLNSLIKDKDTTGRFVLETFVRFGAPKEILYKNKPHIGTDILRRTVQNIREYILLKGAQIYFDTKMTDILYSEEKNVTGVKTESKNGEMMFKSDSVFIAIGHSARDTFEMLNRMHIAMEKKAFSVGVRIEHKQAAIDATQYGSFCNIMRKLNGAADYKLSCKTSGGRGVYTFCMCPGGFVVGAASEKGRLVTNGMSNFARDGKNANSAVLVSVTPEDFPGNNLLDGIEFQRRLEEKAFQLGGGSWKAPVQLYGDFKAGRVSNSLGEVEPTFSNGYKFADLNELIPEKICISLKEGLHCFGQMLEGFDCYDAVLTGIETRSSSPVRILRSDTGCSLSLKGLYPVGEGAGYAGGILSAASDGIKTVEKWLNSL